MKNKCKSSKKEIRYIKYLFNELEYLHLELYKLMDKIKNNLYGENNLMQIYALNFNNIVYDIIPYYKTIIQEFIKIYYKTEKEK